MTDDGYVVWFTGSPARASPPSPGRCWPRLASRGQKVELLDGDEVRTTSSRTSASAQEDRDTNIARIGYVAGKLSKHGVAVLVAAISPYREARDRSGPAFRTSSRCMWLRWSRSAPSAT